MIKRHALIVAVLSLVLACSERATEPTGPDAGSSLELSTHTSIAWKGYTWDVTDAATATVDGSGNLVLTRTAAGDAGVEIGAFDPTINDAGTPWMAFSYQDVGTAMQGYDLFINFDASGPRISAGSLFSCEGLGYERYSTGPPLEDFLFAVGCDSGDRVAGSHTVYIGQRADGTIDALFDGSPWKGSFLKDAGEAPFTFDEVLLRVRGGTVGDTFVFTDFRAGDNHPGGGNKNACKDEGWAASGQWSNQGQCIVYALQGDADSAVVGS